jgi:hypothetical protein
VAVSGLNHRFTATLLCFTSYANTTSSGQPDLPYTTDLGCPTLKVSWVGHAGGRWVGRWVGLQVGHRRVGGWISKKLPRPWA